MPKKGDRLVFDPKKAALLVIDVQNYFAHSDGRAYLPAGKTALPNIFGLMDAFSAKKYPVIATRHCHDSTESLGMLGKFYYDHIKCGEWDSELLEELKNKIQAASAKGTSTDVIKTIQKNTYDAFWNTPLSDHLSKKNITQLVITGCMTHLCCETTARSAFVRGFEVYFVRDATFTKSEALHTGTLNAVADGFGIVVTAEGIKKSCI
jgi:bifunctional isochorismate lyase/aryl carrier protein